MAWIVHFFASELFICALEKCCDYNPRAAIRVCLGGASTIIVLLFAAVMSVMIEDHDKQKRATRSAVAVIDQQGINELSKTGIIASSSPDDVTYH